MAGNPIGQSKKAEFHSGGLSEKVCKSIKIHRVLTDMEHTMAVDTQGSEGVEGAVGVFMCGWEEEQAQAFATSECHQIAGFRLLRRREEIGHFDRDEKGGRATNTNSFDCVGDGAVRGKTLRAGVNDLNNATKGG